MKRRSFQEYLEKRLNKDEIAEIKKQALREIRNAMTKNKHIGSRFDDFLKEKDILEEVELAAIKNGDSWASC